MTERAVYTGVSEPDFHDDDLADAVALVECARGDPEGFGAVARNCALDKTVVILSKLLAELIADNDAGIGACPEPACWRAWASAAIERA
jgi:hypothetical protein